MRFSEGPGSGVMEQGERFFVRFRALAGEGAGLEADQITIRLYRFPLVALRQRRR
jgi:hypothetical protein